MKMQLVFILLFFCLVNCDLRDQRSGVATGTGVTGTGTGVTGTGLTGTGVTETGVTGTGVTGTGLTGTGVTGTGNSGTGYSGSGASGTGYSVTGSSGTGSQVTTGTILTTGIDKNGDCYCQSSSWINSQNFTVAFCSSQCDTMIGCTVVSKDAGEQLNYVCNVTTVYQSPGSNPAPGSALTISNSYGVCNVTLNVGTTYVICVETVSTNNGSYTTIPICGIYAPLSSLTQFDLNLLNGKASCNGTSTTSTGTGSSTDGQSAGVVTAGSGNALGASSTEGNTGSAASLTISLFTLLVCLIGFV